MDLTVLIALLCAAALHAGWNAMVKMDLDRFLTMTLISLSAGAIAFVAIFFVSVPHINTWPYLLVSVCLNTGYKLFLISAYRAGDFGQVYPLARGAAPLFTSFVMMLGFGEILNRTSIAGVALLIIGVWLLSVRGGRDLQKLERRTIAYAIGTSLFIASYTITDGLGARFNDDANSYAIWLFVLNGLMMLVLLLWARGTAQLSSLRPFVFRGLAGGAMILGSYGIVIWATTVAPIALVAAVRETSVLWAAVFSVFFLREPFTKWRLLSSITIIAGIALTRMQ